MSDQRILFGAVDALLEQARPLPTAAKRARLRTAAGLSRAAVGRALGVSGTTVGTWETGGAEPQGDRRAAYVRLLDGLAARYPAPVSPQVDTPDGGGREEQPRASTEARDDDQEHGQEQRQVQPSAGGSGAPPQRRAVGARRPATAAGAGGRFPSGPLAVVDGAGAAYLADGRSVECPAATVPELADWALGAGLGQERLHKAGREADPLVVLTAPAAVRLGLPDHLADRRGLRLPEDHPVVADLLSAGWKLTRRGFGPWARVYRPVKAGGRRQCVQLAVVPWGALDARTWPGIEALDDPAEVARVLGTYATRVLTPRGSAAVNGLELMTALRPATRAARDAAGAWTSAPVAGSLTAATDPAPPEAPEEHPVAQGRPEGGALDEEAYEWTRDPETLSDAECTAPWAVGLDVNMAFAGAANRLTVGLGEPVHTDGPRFDPKLPGCWLVDLSAVETDPRLPSPFTPTGQRPTGPAWYATPTVAYAAELGAVVRPLEAWLRPESGPYLDPWYTRLRDAYMATMNDLGVTKNLSESEFLDAMEQHKAADPGMVAVLAAIKATVKGGIGKLRERPQGRGYRPGERWPALERPTWRPDIRAAVIAQARTNMHRKMRKMAAAGLYPLAVLSDCVVYPSPGPSPLDLLPRTGEGKPLPGTFRIGVSPGMVKLEGVRPLLWAVELLDGGANPARHIKDGTDRDGEE